MLQQHALSRYTKGLLSMRGQSMRGAAGGGPHLRGMRALGELRTAAAGPGAATLAPNTTAAASAAATMRCSPSMKPCPDPAEAS